MPRNTSVTLGEHLSGFVNSKIESGRFEPANDAALNQGKGVDGDAFMDDMIG